MSKPVHPALVSILTAMRGDDMPLAAEVLFEVPIEELQRIAIQYGHLVLEAWRNVAIASDVDPEFYVGNLLAALGQGVAT